MKRFYAIALAAIGILTPLESAAQDIEAKLAAD
jgi:hypothetical protein